ncbi:MAG: putative aminohydrolase SsnA [Anaerolineales bacterium]|nr:putative aminohydrolase SsnA [Anaerolineales bacterium]
MLITNAKVISWKENQEIQEGYALKIEEGTVVDLGLDQEMRRKYPEAETFDARGQYVMPGNICAHTHFYGAFARGMGIPGDAPKDFPEILEKLWWPLDLALDEEGVRYSALVFAVDAIKNGTTTLFDHHASPNFIDGSLDVIGGVIEDAGLRAALCYEVTDRNGKDDARAGIQENMRMIKKTAGNSHLAAAFGLHASLSLSTETLNACREAAGDDVGFHIHVGEHQADEYDSLKRSGMRVVDRLQKHQLLGPRTIVAHGVHIDMQEARLLADSGTWLTHQPRSNMNNAVGAAAVEDFLRLGIPVGIGTDGFYHAMWEEWKTAYFLHKVNHLDPRRMSALDIVQMGVHNNAALANIYFPELNLGVIEPGATADLIFVDYHPHTPLSAGNLPWQIIFGVQESMITSTMVGGKFLMQDRELLTLDEEKIAAEARVLAPDIWSRYEGYVGRYS